MAVTAAAHALAEAILYWRESGESLSKLLQEAATPGGTTAATLAAMDAAGYGRVIERGLAAGIR
jgi:pyrroline-5-carboxylate reductase